MPDIFDFFKENESKLEERPPQQLWDKLEQKLESDKRRKRRRNIRFLQLNAVALMLLVLLFAAALLWYFTRAHEKRSEVAPVFRVMSDE
ncbi:MAG: hypothetical protein J0L99_09245 [Chitinophagales bacterium]|nr:hypothetical protein [Chitinophagales bacterium]